ncbi:MAG: DUF4347 domain-containing protein [Cytophagales bacterium]|nr:DUF4347 domain-containing protein [Rhizobacter sp.]
MPTLTWKDSRVIAKDVAPWDTTVMLVSPTTPIAEMVLDSKSWCEEHKESGSLNLMIYCHGSPAYLQIGKEGLMSWNLSKLAALKPYFDTVSIHACLVAKGQSGRAFCSAMALVLYAPVDGAIEKQRNTGPETVYGWLDDRKYDGDYYRHDPSGARTGPLRSL